MGLFRFFSPIFKTEVPLARNVRFQTVFWKSVKLGGILFLLLAGSGCYTQRVEDAFNGQFSVEESNIIITKYCRTCHTHGNFSPSDHIDKVSLDYKRKVFRYATECRTCHFVNRKWYSNDYERKTRWPRLANRGEYKAFELEVLREKNKGKGPKDTPKKKK